MLSQFSPAGVDLELWAHEHTYERLWPVYRDEVGSCFSTWPPSGPLFYWRCKMLVFSFQVCNGSTEQPYVKPRAPVHIITGSAVSTPVSAVSFVLTGQHTL